MIATDLRNMDKTIYFIGQFNKCSESGDFGNFTFDNFTNLIELVDIGPWIFFTLFQTKRNTLLIGIYVKNDCFNFIAGFEYFIWIIDLTSPGHIRNMDHTVNIVFNFNKCSITGHVTDFALDFGINRIFFHQDFPRITFFLT